MRVHAMAWCVLWMGCAAVEPVERSNEPAGTVAAPLLESAEASTLDEVATKLRARVDLSHLALGPQRDVAPSLPFDENAAAKAIATATGSELASSWQGTRWSAEGDALAVSVDPASGLFELSGVEPFEAGLAHAADAVFEARARALFAGLASDSSEALLEVKHLAATVRVLGTPESVEAPRMGTKVFAFRLLGGIRVAGNRLVATYKTDGTLRGARGLWPQLDLERSKLSSSLTREQVLDRVVELLAARGVRADRGEPIEVESFYELAPGPNGHVATLRAAAMVLAQGPEGAGGRVERHVIDL